MDARIVTGSNVWLCAVLLLCAGFTLAESRVADSRMLDVFMSVWTTCTNPPTDGALDDTVSAMGERHPTHEKHSDDSRCREAGGDVQTASSSECCM
jgi:hypothetical protein